MTDGHLVYLRRGGVGLLMETDPRALPVVLHWGVDLGELPDDTRAAVGVSEPPQSALDEVPRIGLVPEYPRGHAGRAGLEVSRRGRHQSWAPLFSSSTTDVDDDGAGATVLAQDRDLELSLRCRLALEESGLLKVQHTVTNDGTDELVVHALYVVLPVPDEADELLHLTGRWARERSPQRQPFNEGALVRESRRGRTGHDATLLLVAGSNGFGFRHGAVWAIHVAWSGDHVTYAERLPDGRPVLGGGELLAPGEVVLGPGDSYTTPWVLATWAQDGLDAASARIHRWLRSRDSHPRRPRPVVLNTWEAVYFDHDLRRLTALADAAAELGVERFVLDDGWFHRRRDDRRGLGDWTVDADIWPNGLHPLVDHVCALGMEFGLWVEPEMVNPDSDLARAHPDWILRGRDAEPPSWRHQQVLDLQLPGAFAHVRDSLLRLLDEYPISFLKWDHNRDLVDAAHAGRPAVHGQTVAVYALIDELRRAHPGIEIESCASGGGRVDLEMLQRTDRVWASDCNDALERHHIQRWTGLLVPPELVGAHVGPPTAHTTGRTHTLDFRAITALFGHFGIEWDIAGASGQDRARLAEWIGVYRARRSLLHSGLVVHADSADPTRFVHGVVATDRTEAVFALVSLASSRSSRPGRLRLPGLDPDSVYRVSRVGPADDGGPDAPDGAFGPVEASGAWLAQIGITAPMLWPESGIVVEATVTR